MGIGVVINDSIGEVLARLSLRAKSHSKSIVAKIAILRRAMVFCLELGFDQVQFEGDAQLVVNAINNENECSA